MCTPAQRKMSSRSFSSPQPRLLSPRKKGFYYQSGWCPGEAWGPGGSSAAQARVGKGPRCTPYAVPVPASSARSDRPIPHRLHGIKHPLTNAGPSLKRTRTPSCTNHSDDRARAHWPTAPRAVGKHRGDDRRRLGRPPKDLRQAAHPLVLDCALYERECNRPHVRSNAFTSPASPHPHGITSSAIGSLLVAVNPMGFEAMRIWLV